MKAYLENKKASEEDSIVVPVQGVRELRRDLLKLARRLICLRYKVFFINDITFHKLCGSVYNILS